MDAKQLLLKQTREAFADDEGMSLQSALRDLTQEEASWRLNDTTWTIEEILYHVASCKLNYCQQGFARPQPAYGRPMGDLPCVLDLLRQAHEHLVECLEACSEEDVEKPIPTSFHGQSAAHFFWVMVMHDVSHGAQIRTIRRAYGSRTHYYRV